MLFCADKPGNVKLNLSYSGDVCNGSMVNFTCTANANPQVDTYSLYKGDFMIANLGGSGVTRRVLNTTGRIKYRCDASNSVGSDRSSDTVLTVPGELA